MADNSQKNPHSNGHQGSPLSYMIGFLLSLVLTLVPYYMVREHITSGTTLLVALLGFAVAQMFVQIFFFLHLGRGPKPFYNIIFFFGTAGMMIMVVGASIIIMNSLYRHMSPEEVTVRMAQDENIAQVGDKSTGACQGRNESHMVMIRRGEVSPLHVNASRCDTLTFMSSDGTGHTLIFGTPEQSESYGGLFDVKISGTRNKTINLNQTGSFMFYDEASHETVGYVTVEQ